MTCILQKAVTQLSSFFKGQCHSFWWWLLIMVWEQLLWSSGFHSSSCKTLKKAMYSYNGASITTFKTKVPFYIELEPASLQSRDISLWDVQLSHCTISLLVLKMLRISVHIKNLNINTGLTIQKVFMMEEWLNGIQNIGLNIFLSLKYINFCF
jgi:hypothetical protein